MLLIFDFLGQLKDYIGIFVLMLSSFCIGYFLSYWLLKDKYESMIDRFKKKINLLKKQNEDIHKTEKLKNMVDIPLIVPAMVADRVQEVHIKIIHTFIEGIERNLFPEHYQ